MNKILGEIRGLTTELTLPEIQKILSGQKHIFGFERFTFFKKEKYQRNTILKRPNFELVCICWLPGQYSSIHSHGETIGGMRLLCGQVTEDEFNSPDDQSPAKKRVYAPGDCGWVTRNTLHRVGNASDEPAVTLHLYSPPFQAVVQTQSTERMAVT